MNTETKSPLRWVPSAYFAMGLPFVIPSVCKLQYALFQVLVVVLPFGKPVWYGHCCAYAFIQLSEVAVGVVNVFLYVVYLSRHDLAAGVDFIQAGAQFALLYLQIGYFFARVPPIFS